MRFSPFQLPQWARVVIGIGLFTTLVVYVGGHDIYQLLSQLEMRWVLVAAVCITLATLLAAFNIHLLITRHNAISFTRFLRGYWFAWAIGLVVPGQVGDIASLSIWLKSRGFAVDVSVGVSLLDKLISLSWMLLLGALGIVISGSSLALTLNQAIVAGAVIVGIGGVVVYQRKRMLAWIRSRSGFFSRVTHTIVETANRARLRVLINIVVTLIKVLLIGLAYWSVFRALGFDQLTLATTVPLVAASSLIAYVPISFNGIGTVELTALVLFGGIGLPTAGVLSAFLILRLITFVLAWSPALVLATFGGPKTRHAFD